MLVSCVDKKKKRKLSSIDYASSMWPETRGTPLPNGNIPSHASSGGPPQAVALAAMRRHARALLLLVAFAVVTYVSLSSRMGFGGTNSLGTGTGAGDSERLRTPDNWRSDELVLPQSNNKHANVRREPVVAPPAPDSFGLVIVADLDKKSRDEESKKPLFVSYLLHATLKVTPAASASSAQQHDSYAVAWGEEQRFTTPMNEAGRGAELSELAWFNGKLLAFDDRTGIVFRLKDFEGAKPVQAIPEHIVMEGDGLTGKGQKHEWATVKDGELYMGSVGKEFTDNDGNVLSNNNQWVAIMDETGEVRHEEWTSHFAAVRAALGCNWPGYVVHEAIEWSPVRRQWFILPRRVSTEPYDDMSDELRGSNKVVIASEDFSSIEVREVGTVTPLRGFSSFKFVPRTDDSIIVAIKSVEVETEQRQTSYITVFHVDGTVLLDETELPGGKKFEGVAFAHDWTPNRPGQHN